MWKKVGLTRRAKCARKTREARRGKSISSGDTFMWPVWKSLNPATFSRGFSLVDVGSGTFKF